MLTKAQLKASKKYQDKFDSILVRVPMGDKEVICGHAAKMDESMTAFIRRAIDEAIERDNLNFTD